MPFKTASVLAQTRKDLYRRRFSRFRPGVSGRPRSDHRNLSSRNGFRSRDPELDLGECRLLEISKQDAGHAGYHGAFWKKCRRQPGTSDYRIPL